MTLVRRAFNSLAWNYVARLGDAGGLYVINIIIARSLGVAGYGVFAFLMSAAQLLLTASSLGLEASLNRHIPLLPSPSKPGAIRFLLRRIMLLRIALLCAVFAAAWFTFSLPSWMPDAPGAGPALLLGFIVARSLTQLLGITLTAQLETRIPAETTVLVRALEIAGVSILALTGMRIHYIFGFLMLTGFLHVLMYGVRFRPPLVGPAEPVPLRPLLVFGGIFYVNTIVDYMLGRFGDILFLSKLVPDSRQTGLYEAGAGLVQAAGMAATIGFSGVTFALFSGFSAEGGAEKLGRLYRVTVRLISSLTIPVFAFLLFNAEGLIAVLFGERYAGAVPLVQLLAAFRLAARLFGGGENSELLLARGNVKTVTAFGVAAALVNIAGDITLIPSFGARGAVLASGSANLLVTVSTALFVRKVVGAGLQPAFHLRLLAAFIPAAWAVSLFQTGAPLVQLAMQGAGYLFIALGLLTLLKPFLKEDLELLENVRPGISSSLRMMVRFQ